MITVNITNGAERTSDVEVCHRVSYKGGRGSLLVEDEWRHSEREQGRIVTNGFLAILHPPLLVMRCWHRIKERFKAI